MSKDTLVVRFPYDTYLDHHTIDVSINQMIMAKIRNTP